MAHALLALALGGCAGSLTVRGEVQQPARVPVRAFPRILVVAEPNPESVRVAQALTEHLSGGRSEVRRVPADVLEAWRAEDHIPRATVIIEVRTELLREERPAWAQRQGMLTCGPGGCFESRRPYVQDVPVITGTVDLRVLEGQSGRALQREHFEEEEAGPDVLGMRLRVLQRLTQRVRDLVDQRTEQVAVSLYPLDRPAVREALEAIGRGQWARGRRILEAFVTSAAFETLSDAERALVLYDLGQARRFDATVPADERFENAAEALRAAVRLDPVARYASAVGALDDHRRSRAMIRAQEEATSHNFRLAQNPSASVPEPPESYR